MIWGEESSVPGERDCRGDSWRACVIFSFLGIELHIPIT